MFVLLVLLVVLVVDGVEGQSRLSERSRVEMTNILKARIPNIAYKLSLENVAMRHTACDEQATARWLNGRFLVVERKSFYRPLHSTGASNLARHASQLVENPVHMRVIGSMKYYGCSINTACQQTGQQGAVVACIFTHQEQVVEIDNVFPMMMDAPATNAEEKRPLVVHAVNRDFYDDAELKFKAHWDETLLLERLIVLDLSCDLMKAPNWTFAHSAAYVKRFFGAELRAAYTLFSVKETYVLNSASVVLESLAIPAGSTFGCAVLTECKHQLAALVCLSVPSGVVTFKSTYTNISEVIEVIVEARPVPAKLLNFVPEVHTLTPHEVNMFNHRSHTALSANKLLQRLGPMEASCRMLEASVWQYRLAKLYGLLMRPVVSVNGFYGWTALRSNRINAVRDILYRRIQNLPYKMAEVNCVLIPDCLKEQQRYVVVSCLYTLE